MTTDLSLDFSVLESLDFPTACGHSMHSEESPWHGGEAKFVAVAYHNCPYHAHPSPYFYPACSVWANYVKHCIEQSLTIRCARCGEQGYWEDMVQIVSVL